MVFGTMTANPGVAPRDGKGSPLSNGANDYFSGDGDGGAKSSVDLPLRLGSEHHLVRGVSAPYLEATLQCPQLSVRVGTGALSLQPLQ